MRRFHGQGLHFAKGDEMVTGLIYDMKIAIEPCYHIIKDGNSAWREPIGDISKFVLCSRRKGCADSDLMGSQHVDVEMASDLHFGHVVDNRSGKKPTSGGDNDTEVKDPTAKPTGLPSAGMAVITHTPVG